MLKGWKGRVAVVLIALSPFLLLEIVLRVTGYGRDPLANFAPDAKVYCVSDGVVRVSSEYERVFRTRPFPREKPAGTVRIFAVGDSVTHGWTCVQPGEGGGARILLDPWPTMLEAELRQRLRNRTIEVLNCGGLAHASRRLIHVVDELLEFSPDLLILMTGSTEYCEARAYMDWKAMEEKGVGFLRHWRTLTFARDLLRDAKADERTEEALSEDPVWPPTTTEKDEVRGPWEIEAVIRHSTDNVRRMIKACRAAGVPVVICTAPCDLRYPPHFRSAEIANENWSFVNQEGEFTRAHFKHRVADVLLGEEGRFVLTVQRAVSLNGDGAHIDALVLVDAALREMPDERRIAVLHYCRGVALDGLGRFAEARVAYANARDLNLLPKRALGKLNDGFRALDAEPGVYVADVEAAFAASVPDGIPDDRLFYDNCHPKPPGHALIAKTVLSVLTLENLLE